jgi:hypothetical protein
VTQTFSPTITKTASERREPILFCAACLHSYPAADGVKAAIDHGDCFCQLELLEYSEDVRDPAPHGGRCEVCGEPAPVQRVSDLVRRRLCWDATACQARADAKAEAEHDAWSNAAIAAEASR